ncbi:MAG: hypothetical protein WAT93_03445 [Pontixanthobacter sp.]
MPRFVNNELAMESVRAVEAHGNIKEAAKALGVKWHTVRDRLRVASERNLTGELSGSTIPPGFAVKGVSTLYNAKNEKVAEWVKTDREKQAFADTLETVREAFADIYRLPATDKPSGVDADLLTVYPVADHHLGLYAWREEAGEDYDLSIGVDLLRKSIAQLSQSAPPSKTGVILALGDFFHADSNLLRTLRSNHPLDHDGRWQKVLRAGVHLFRDCVSLALKRHERVIVHVIPGNHDDHSSAMLSVGMEMAFSDEPRVEVDMSPSRIWCRRFGEVLIAAAHGDMAKPADLPGAIAANYAPDWGASKYRQIFTGHIHHQTRLEKWGAVVESMSTLAAKDSHAAGMGYSSQRSACAVTFHTRRGEYIRNTVTV